MKSRTLSRLARSKVAKPFTKNGRPNWPLLFITMFVLVGTYMLVRSKAAAGNDLVVTSVSMSPASPTAGQAVTFSAVVKNQGTTATTAGTAVAVGFSIDGQTVSWNRSNTASLAAGASVTLTANAGSPGATWTATGGPHTLVATADDQNVIPDEADEANNIRTQTFTIGNTGNLYINPSNTTVQFNTNFTVDLRLTPGTNVDGVEATITYDQNKFQYVSMDPTGTPFDIELGTQSGGSGTVSIARGNLSGGVSADALVTKITFKALAGTGTGTLTVAGNATKSGVYTNPTLTSGNVNFFTPDTTPPAVSVTSPANGSNIWQVQTVNVNATDAVGVTKVELYVDGQLKGSDTTSPYSFSLDTRTLSNSSHTIVAKGYDAANNIGNSSNVTVSVRNWNEDINQDGSVNLLDFSLLAAKYGQTGATLGRPDINGDQKVDLLDFSLLAAKYGQ